MGKSDNRQSRQWQIVLESYDKESNLKICWEDLLNEIPDYFNAFGCSVYMIDHDKDTADDGTMKREHFHIVLVFPTRHTKHAVIKLVSDCVGCSEKIVTADICKSLNYGIRYLCHLDDPSKHRYDTREVFTNDYDNFILAINNQIGGLTFVYLDDVVSKSPTIHEVIKKIGLNNYKNYRWVIMDLVDFYGKVKSK